VDAGESVGGLVSHGFIDGTIEHRSDGASCAVVHAVVELEVTDRKLGVVEVMVKRIESGLVETAVLGELGVESLKCIEKLPLVGVIERLAEVGVLQIGADDRTGCKSRDQDKSDHCVPGSYHQITSPRA
jgi:hypothetical protein